MGVFLDPGAIITADRRQGSVTRVVGSVPPSRAVDAGIGCAAISCHSRMPPRRPQCERKRSRSLSCDGFRSVGIPSAAPTPPTPAHTRAMRSLRPGGPSQGRATSVGDYALSLRAQPVACPFFAMMKNASLDQFGPNTVVSLPKPHDDIAQDTVYTQWEGCRRGSGTRPMLDHRP